MLNAQAQIQRFTIEQHQAIVDLSAWESEIKIHDKGISEKSNPIESIQSNGKSYEPSVLVMESERDLVGTSSTKTISGSDEEERKKGNDMYSKRQYKEALQSYTNAIQLNPKSAVAYGNRAMTFLKLQDWRRAEADASTAVNLDPLHFKSYQRRSVARTNLGKHQAALRDLYFAQSAASKHGVKIKIDASTVERNLVEAMHKAPKRSVDVKIIPKERSNVEMLTDAKHSSQSYEIRTLDVLKAKPPGDVDRLMKAKSWYHFEQAWMTLSDSQQVQVLSKLKPERFKKIFQRGMENVGLMISIVSACTKNEVDGIKVLDAISHLPSVDMLVMMMSKEERDAFVKCISCVTSNLEPSKIQEITKRFGV